MVAKWVEVTLGEAATSIQTGPFGSQLHKADYVDEGIPSIMPVNISDNRITTEGIARITEADAERLSKYRVETGDVVYSRRGDVERRALVREAEDGWLCGTGCLRVRFDKARVNPEYASFQLGSARCREWVVRHAVGATMPNLNTSILSAVPFILPPLPEQKAIAHILGTLDDKIELNRKMNATLEGMAQALFKSWFVDFDPVIDNALAAGNPIPDELTDRAEVRRQALANGTANRETAKHFPAAFKEAEELGCIPEGWEVSKAEAIVTRHKVKQKFTKKNALADGSVPIFDQGAGLLLGYSNQPADQDSSKNNPKFIFGDHTCITYLSTKPFSVGPNVIPLSAKKYAPYWTFYAVKDLQEFQEYRRHWMEFSVKSTLLPSLKLADIFDDQIRELRASMESNDEISKTLTKLRDTLLPKLISGELHVPIVEQLNKEQLP